MGRARRATAAAYGGGGVLGLGALAALGYGVLLTEAKVARRSVGTPFEQAPGADGLYGPAGLLDADGAPDGEETGPDALQLVVLGDSSAAGLGVDEPAETPAAIIATGLAVASGRPVRLTNVAVVGATSADLQEQLDRLLAIVEHPDAAMVMVGANDVTHRVKASDAVRELVSAVHALRDAGAGVVVGTCPDLGAVQPVPQPLRQLARHWSRDLAAAQTVAVVEAGGRTVSLGDLLGPDFAAYPNEMFSADRFHPSATGYAKAAAALLPSVCAELGLWPDGGCERLPDFRRGEAVEPVSRAAVRAVRDAGTEVSASELGGRPGVRGRRGVWAVLLRRRQEPVEEVVDGPDGTDGADSTDGADVAHDAESPRLAST